ncbi:MAG: hypothetical protein K6E59_04480, partial [Bacilli bacterium]|nr:hypothetical protein [Bacilli bacterium]
MKTARRPLSSIGAIALAAIALASCNSNADSSVTGNGNRHTEIDEDSNVVLDSTEGNPITIDHYRVPNGAGYGEDVNFTLITSPAKLPYSKTSHAALFFFGNLVSYCSVELRIDLSNISHIRLDYYLSENDDDNACGVEWVLSSQYGGSDAIAQNRYVANPGAGYIEWTRPADLDPTRKANFFMANFSS